ncbi:hypothetical protein D7X33_27460 [Butyricicoccus sp. 1XD8-22]|nr:hypothetical protein D7X33_27460 [Butyricicoccus sp. 1XD8-22]
MIETRNDWQDKPGTSEQECREKLLDQLAETLERVAEDRAEISDLQSCLERFDKEDLIEVDAEQALARFREKHHVLMLEEKGIRMPACRHPTRKYFRRFAAVVAAAVFFSTMYIAGASDEGITKMIGRWTDETFHFGGVGRESISEEVPVDVKSGIEGNYDSIEAALSACEITQAVFPQWIPDRFQLEEIYVRQLGTGFCAVSADYSCAGTSRIFTVDIMKFDNIADASSYVFEKDDAPVIEYECDGVNHYLIHNPAGDAVIWNNGDLVCSITGDLRQYRIMRNPQKCDII